MSNTIHDANSALRFLQGQRARIERAAYNSDWPDIVYDSLIPVDTSGSIWDSAVVTMRSDMDGYGQAEFINGNADDVPMANAGMTADVNKVHLAGIGYWYGFQELNQAQQLGVSLTEERARAARRKAELFKQKIALEGDESKGMSGLVGNTTYDIVDETNGSWDDTDDVQNVLTDINNLLLETGNGEAVTADTLLIPADRMQKLAGRVIDNTGITWLQFIANNNILTSQTGNELRIRGLVALNDNHRAIAYQRSSDVLALRVPGEHRFLEPFRSGPLRIDVPGIMSVAGLQIKQPDMVKGMDNL